MDVHRHGPDMAAVRDDVHHALRELVVPAVLRVQVVERLNVLEPGVGQLVTHVRLEEIGRLVVEHAGLEDGLGIRARPAGDRLVDDLPLWILRVELIDQLVEPGSFATGGPPREDLDLRGAGARACPG